MPPTALANLLDLPPPEFDTFSLRVERTALMTLPIAPSAGMQAAGGDGRSPAIFASRLAV